MGLSRRRLRSHRLQLLGQHGSGARGRARRRRRARHERSASQTDDEAGRAADRHAAPPQSQHVGGFILTERPLTETVPIGNGAMDDRTFIEWDKDDIEELGILKIDVLALGMLTCIRKCFDLIEQHHGERWELATVPQEVPEVYDMLCRGDSLGVFQVESRAQMNMLPTAQAALFLRPGHRSRDRPARADPGRHGASISEAPHRQGTGDLPLPRSRARRRRTSWRRSSDGRSACRSSRSRR